jgi:hypothetical protein
MLHLLVHHVTGRLQKVNVCFVYEKKRIQNGICFHVQGIEFDAFEIRF